MTRRGRLIAFEGGEGSGKSTQARRLADDLGAVLTHEPGATELGSRIRSLVLALDTRMEPISEALLLAADRAQHVAEVVAPALARGDTVVTDRYSASSLAYQGYGRGLDVEQLARLSAWATGGIEPDLVVLLDVPPAVARARLGKPADRMEAESEAFHERVTAGFRALADGDPGRWVKVDGVGSVDEVAGRVRLAAGKLRG